MGVKWITANLVALAFGIGGYMAWSSLDRVKVCNVSQTDLLQVEVMAGETTVIDGPLKTGKCIERWRFLDYEGDLKYSLESPDKQLELNWFYLTPNMGGLYRMQIDQNYLDTGRSHPDMGEFTLAGARTKGSLPS